VLHCFSDNVLTHWHVGKLTKNEMLERGAVTLSTYKRYIKAAGGPFIAGLLFFLILLNQLSQAFSNYWLTYWLKDGSGVSNFVVLLFLYFIFLFFFNLF